MEDVKWRKSSRSNANGENCVEVARTDTQDIATRDSKNPAGPQLRFNRREWAALLDGIKSGKYEL
jgi:hypothetical protein